MGLPVNAVPASIQLDHTGVMSAVSGPPLPPISTTPSPRVTVYQRLCKHSYLQSLFLASATPSDAGIANLVNELPNGVSIATHSFLDNQEVLHGWIVYSSNTSSRLISGIVSRELDPGVSSEQRSLLESIVQVLYLLRTILQVHQMSGCKLSLFCSSKSTTRLLCNLHYRNVWSSLDDNGDLIAELQYQQKQLEKLSSLQFTHCDLTSTKCNGVAKQHMEDLGSEFNSFRMSAAYSPRSVPYINPPHNAVLMSYGGHPLLT
jgi:hypothetical protein